MSTADDLKVIVQLASELDPAGVAREVAWMTSSRIKAWSAETGGSRSAEAPLPLPDRLDKKVRASERAFKRHIRSAREALAIAATLQEYLLVRLTLEEAQKKIADEAAAVCLNCGRVVECTSADRCVAGRCFPCYEFHRRHGEERPRELWEAA